MEPPQERQWRGITGFCLLCKQRSIKSHCLKMFQKIDRKFHESWCLLVDWIHEIASHIASRHLGVLSIQTESKFSWQDSTLKGSLSFLPPFEENSGIHFFIHLAGQQSLLWVLRGLLTPIIFGKWRYDNTYMNVYLLIITFIYDIYIYRFVHFYIYICIFRYTQYTVVYL